jgi:crossover junction endodeoxyribonuclease RuvC
MIVLGVDPGSIRTGWGVIERTGTRLRFVGAGTIQAGKDERLEMRLLAIYTELGAVITRYAPSAMAVEDIFHARFAGSALKLGHARGVALLAGASAGLEVAAYPPALVKRSIAGRGQADKEQVARIVAAILGARELPTHDASDALAVAITHAQALMSNVLPARKK